MKIKAKRSASLYCCLLFLSGCSLGGSSSQQTIELQEPTDQAVGVKTSDRREPTDQEMKIFFQQYLTIDEETMLILNQKPKEITPEYWEAHTTYKIKTNDILGDYLSEDAKLKLNKQYSHDDFDYPRLLEINEYIVTGISNVEDATIISKQHHEEKELYYVMVTATAKVVDASWGNHNYRWDKSKGYYVKNLDMHLGTKPQEDLIKITLNYWVELEQNEIFLVNSVKEKSTIHLGIHEQASIANNYFIARAPYYSHVADKDKENIYKFLDTFMKQEYNYYRYYRKAYNTSYEMLKITLGSDLGLFKVINLKKENYQSSFNPTIIPLKDNMEFLTFNVDEDIVITPHISSSKRHHTYEVLLQVDGTLFNGEVITYEYIYLFSLENDMIYAVRLMKERKIQAKGETEKYD